METLLKLKEVSNLLTTLTLEINNNNKIRRVVEIKTDPKVKNKILITISPIDRKSVV